MTGKVLARYLRNAGQRAALKPIPLTGALPSNFRRPRSFLTISYALVTVPARLIHAAIAATRGRMESLADKLRLTHARQQTRPSVQDAAAAGPRASWHHPADLAGRLGCAQPAICQAEAGGASLGAATLQRLACALGCDLQIAIVSREATLNMACSPPSATRS